MKYAVILSGGKQYKVVEGQEILVDRINQEKDSKYLFKQVFLLRTDKDTLFGTPNLDNCQVEGKIVNHEKGKKIIVAKFKAKSRYRRKQGFRPQLTRVLIEKISLKKQSKSAPAPKKKAAKGN